MIVRTAFLIAMEMAAMSFGGPGNVEFRADFEPGDKPEESGLLSGAVLTVVPEEAIAGRGSLKGDFRDAPGVWHEFYESPEGLLKPRTGYTITFDYRILGGADAAFYTLFRRRGKASHTESWTDLKAEAGTVGQASLELYTGTAGDFCLIVGVKSRGAMVIDNLTVRTNPLLHPQGVALPPIERTWTSPGRMTYYIDSETGDDTRDGLTPARAWKTLTRVNQGEFGPGDRILLRAGGRWAGPLTPGGRGTDEAPVSIGDYGGGPSPRIDGEAAYLTTVLLHNVEYFHVSGLDITNTGRRCELARTGVLLSLKDFGTAHDVRLSGLFVHDVNGGLRKKEGAGSAIRWTCEGKNTLSRFDGLLIEDCLLKDCTRNGITAGGHWQRDNWFPSLNVVIRGNTIEGIPGDGIVPTACDGALVEHNVMRDCPRLLPDGEAAAGIWPWSCDNTVVQFNEVSDHKAPWDGQGFDADWNCRGTIIQHNYSHDNEGGFLLICCSGRPPTVYNIGNPDVIVRYNISVNDGLRATGKHAGFSPTFHISGACRGSRIHNNLILIPAKPDDTVARQVLKMDRWGGPWPDDTLFARNVFVAREPVTWDLGEARGTRFTENLFVGTHSGLDETRMALRLDESPFGWDLSLPDRDAAVRAFRPTPDSPLVRILDPLPSSATCDFSGRELEDRHGFLGPLAPESTLK